MAKQPASDSIMASEKMKPLLALSKREPVQAAIGLTGEGEAVILLDKKAKPKKVLSMMRGLAGKAKINLSAATLRFGRAEVDTDYDSGTVRFFVNKETPGNMRPKLIEIVKRIAYQKVEINVDPSLDEESEDEDEAPQAEAIPPAPPPPAEPDAAALAQALAALAGGIAKATQSDPGRRAALAQMAADANARLKSGDLPGAGQAIAALRTALDSAPPPAAPPADPAALRKELATLIGAIPQAAGDDAARRAALAKLAGDANAALKANDAAAAGEAIGRLRDALAAPADADAGEELRERLDVCRDDLRRIADADARAAMTRSIAEISALLQDNKAGAAATLLDVLETQIGEAIRAARQGEVGREAGHLVEFAKLQLRWREAQSRFDANLKSIGDALLSHPEIREDPRLDAIRAGIAAFPTLVPDFGGDLEAALDAGTNAADPAAKARHAAAASQAIDAYRQRIAAAGKLAQLEQFASQDLSTRAPLQDALDQVLVELKQHLAASA